MIWFSQLRKNHLRFGCKYVFLTTFTILFGGFVNLIAQDDNPIFERFNTSHGLSNNLVISILQDSKGYLWIGTNDGLNKYDGYNFTSYRHDPQDSTSISNNVAITIFEDSAGDIWIGTEGSLNLYDDETGSFKNFIYNTELTGTQADQFLNGVISIVEDEEGNLWLASILKGLIKLDRRTNTFSHFYIDSTVTSSVNIFMDIIEDKTNKGKGLYLGTFMEGLCYFDFETQKIVQIKPEDKISAELRKNQIRDIAQDDAGNVWIGNDGSGLFRYDTKTETFSSYKHNAQNSNSISSNQVRKVYLDPEQENILWVGTRSGLNRFDIHANSFKVYKSDINDTRALSNDAVFDIYKDKSGVMWFGTLGGLNKVDPGRVPFKHFTRAEGSTDGLNSNSILSIHKSLKNPDIIWLGTINGGLNRYDRKNDQFSYFRYNASDINSLGSDNIRVIFEDPAEAGEILWLGTWGGGLNRFDLKKGQFKSYKHNELDETTISSNLIHQIYETRDGMLWVTTARGLNQFDRKKEIFTNYLYQDTTYVQPVHDLLKRIIKSEKPIASHTQIKNDANLSQTFELNKKTNVLVISMGEMLNELWDFGWLEDTDGNEIWKMSVDESKHAGGARKNRMQISSVELEKGSYNLKYKSDDSHSYNNWNAAAPIQPLWWGIQLFEIDEEDKNLLTQNMNKFIKPNSIPEDATTAILEDSYGMIWIGTESKGLSKFDRKTSKFTNYALDRNNPNSLSNNYIHSLFEDRNGVLWIGTRGGINKYDSKTNSFKSYTTKDGLPNNIIQSMIEDTSGCLWLATNNGISKFNPADESLTFINYNVQDGLQYTQYFTRSAHDAADGELFFGGYNGFVSFYPGKINPQPPRTLLSEFRIFNEPIKPGEGSPLEKHISETKNIRLTYDQNVFSFEFVALHFSQPLKNKYLYKMEGFDKNWIDGHRRFAPYTNIDPGKYTFRVKASNSNGIWNETGASLDITILPPWWRTVWAYIGYGLIIIALVFGFDRVQRRRVMAKAKEKMKIQAAEHRAEAAELKARAVQAENERKTRELEEARALQLSMLPKELPQLPNLDIAVYMQTATEVGGDYYDFHVSMDGTLTVVVGDATGHGMKAGTMVTAAKSLFNSYAPNPDILYSFQEITRCIRQMNFNKLSMCLTMVKIQGNKLQMSTAGMPPSFIFRKDTGVVEEHLFQAMPLGTMQKFPYEKKETTLRLGDTILLMSDGLPELENKKGETYGYKRIRNGFEDVAEKSPDDIVSYLKNEGAVWVDNENPGDDVTFVVLKVKN
jgi:ligand-binding sensor domain-containing protein/serine phosphatase RsbU (regulator of sigma subunit)